MSDQPSIFFDEWCDCLRSHFLYVVQADDQVTLPTLQIVLRDAGVGDDEIEAWY